MAVEPGAISHATTHPGIRYHSHRSCRTTGDGVDALGELDGLGPLKPVTGADAEIDTEAAEKLEEAAAQEKPETEDPAAAGGKDDPRSRPWTDEEDAKVRERSCSPLPRPTRIVFFLFIY